MTKLLSPGESRKFDLKILLGFVVLLFVAIGYGIYSYGPLLKDLADRDCLHYDWGTGDFICPRFLEYKLDEPLISVETCPAHPNLSKTILLKKSAAEAFIQARQCWRAKYDGAWIQKTKLPCIQVNSHLRDARYQFDLCERMKTTAPEVPCAKPGESFHQLGQAIDIENFQETDKCLEAAGFAGGLDGICKDPWHFGFNQPMQRCDSASNLWWYVKKWGKKKGIY